jgi:hypothetical protein
MYRSAWCPPALPGSSLIGGPLVSLVGLLVVLGAIPAEGPARCWWPRSSSGSCGIGIYLIVKGYRTSSPALAENRAGRHLASGWLRLNPACQRSNHETTSGTRAGGPHPQLVSPGGVGPQWGWRRRSSHRRASRSAGI